MDDALDGGVYADGRTIIVRAKRTERGITLGGPIGECDTEEQAQTIAETFAENVLLSARIEALEVMLRETWQSEWNQAIEAAADIAKDYNDAAETHIRNLRRQP